MIKFLDLEKFIKNLMPVTTTEYFTRAGEFHIDGLFSEKIFGVSDRERISTFSYIELCAKVIHPEALKILIQLDQKVEKFISTEEKFQLDSDSCLQVSDGGVTGIEEFIKLFPKVKFRGETPTREKLIKVINQAYKNNILFINKLPVIPPEQRPAFKDVEGNWTMDTLNDVYLNVLRRAFQVRSAAGSGPLFDILNYGLQSAVSDHHKFIHTKVGKKHGVIRDQLLSKRVDFTGRAVITPGPDLKVNEMGIPLRIAVNLFEPFLIHQLLYTDRINKELLSKEIKAFNDLELSVDGVKRVINAIKTGDVIPKTLHDIFFEATEVAMIGRVILSKRDPALHAESVRAYKPVLVDGNTLRLCTLACACHNADFDGDSAICNIQYFKDSKKYICHISEVLKKEKFKLITKEEKQSGIIVEKYQPSFEMYIDSINTKIGDIEKKRVTEYSIHNNIEMYKISDKKERFDDFWTSYDHSLIIYDKNKDEIRKISPKELIKNPENKFLIKRKKKHDY
jgi:DNA-directed RNA polymerase beta' subunit